MLYDTDRSRLLARVKAALGAEAGEGIAPLIRPTIGFAAAPVSSGRSKLGGLPDLPEAVDWPTRSVTPRPPSFLERLMGKRPPPPAMRPLPFLAQIALDEIPAQHLDLQLPRSGVLYFFYDPDSFAWGFSPEDRAAWKVIYAAEPGQPREMPETDQSEVFGEVALRPTPGWITPPHDYRSAPGAPVLTPEEADALAEAIDDDEAEPPPEVRLGGWPMLIQNDIQSEAQLASNGVDTLSGPDHARGEALLAEAWRWRLLLEIGSVDAAGMMWGDVGSLYFQMRDDDLAAGRWDRAWMALQCS